MDQVHDALALRGALAPKRQQHYPEALTCGVEAIDECGFELRDGGVLSIVGPSGAGKTQLLLLLMAATLRVRRRDVVYVACTISMDRERLRQLCELYRRREEEEEVHANGGGMRKDEGDVHVYRVTSGLQLVALLTTLTDLVRTRAGSNIGLICIDGLGATFYGDRLAGRSETVARWLLRLCRTAAHAYLAVSECALFDHQRVTCTPPLDTPITRPGPFMPRQFLDAVTHTVVLYTAEGRRGALLLHDDPTRHNTRPDLVAAGELVISDDLVELRATKALTCTLTESCP